MSPLAAQASLLASFIPSTVARKVLEGTPLLPGEAGELTAATLFADISGFTGMSEELASDGPRGAEELNRILLATFGELIKAIHGYGGIVCHFHGDAISAYFPDDDGRAGDRALECGWAMQQLMKADLARVRANRPPRKNPDFHLTMRIGLSYGRCVEVVVGDAAEAMEYVFAGAAVDEAAAMASRAAVGGVAAGPLLPAGTSAKGVAEVRDPGMAWHTYGEEALNRLVTHASRFMPQALLQRVLAMDQESIADHRPVTSMFVQFDFDDGSGAAGLEMAATIGRLLQDYYSWASEIVARYSSGNARVNRILTGDKGNQLHIIFGAPIAPDAPEQAIQCALSLQREKPETVKRQRIGLASGKVFAGPIGSLTRREYTVVGDVVNRSARLTQLCEPGRVLTDEITAERTQRWFHVRPGDAIKLKGRQEVVTPHTIVAERRRSGQLESYFGMWNKPICGRQSELDLILGGMDAALLGIGGVAAVFGPTGVGKTHIISEAARTWQQSGGIGLAAECQPQSADIPYSLWQGIWREFFAISPDMDPYAQLHVLRERVSALVPEAADDATLLGRVLGLPVDDAGPVTTLAPELFQSRLFDLIRRCFEAEAQRQPILFVAEGLHWADQSSLLLIDELASRLEQHRIFLVLAFRPIGELNLATLKRSICIPIAVADLPPEEAREMLHGLIGDVSLPAAAERQLGLRDREGRESPVNPLFLEEALGVMLASHVLHLPELGNGQSRARIDLEMLNRMAIPDSIHGMLLARLDRLPASHRDLLQIAAVIGREFSLEPLDAITPSVPLASAVTMLSDLSEAEMTRLVSQAPETVYLFQHAMTHEVAYESLSFARRQILHAAVAAWLRERFEKSTGTVKTLLAYHYGRAADHENCFRYALAAGDDARDIYANREAVEMYNLAEEHLKAPPMADSWEEAVRLHLARGAVQILLGDIARAADDAATALEMATSRQQLQVTAEAHNLLAEVRWRQGEFDEAERLAHRVIIELKDGIDADQLARGFIWHGWAAISMYQYESALESLQKAEEVCIKSGNFYRLARVLEAVSYAHFSRHLLEPALEAMKRSLELTRDYSTRINVGIAQSNIAFVQYTLGRPQEALDTLEEAVAIGRDISDYLLVVALSNRAMAQAYLGRYGEALGSYEEAADLLDGMDHPQQWIETYLSWGYDYCCALGEWQDASYRLEKAWGMIARQPERYPEERVKYHIGTALVLLNSRAPAEAGSNLQAAEELVEVIGSAWWQPALCYYRGIFREATQDPGEARTQYRLGLEAVERGGSPDYHPLLLLALARLEPKGEAQAELLEQCVLTAERRARYADRVYCFKSAGEILSGYGSEKLRELGRKSLNAAEELERTGGR